MNSNDLSAAAEQILEEHGGASSSIIAVLQDIQERYHYLPREVFPLLSQRLGLSEAQIYSIATFYENFSLEPKGKFIIKVCDGTACHIRKSIPILERMRKELSLEEGKNTCGDLSFTLETVACLGACGLAPVITVNDKVYPSMTPDKAVSLIDELRKEL